MHEIRLTRAPGIRRTDRILRRTLVVRLAVGRHAGRTGVRLRRHVRRPAHTLLDVVVADGIRRLGGTVRGRRALGAEATARHAQLSHGVQLGVRVAGAHARAGRCVDARTEGGAERRALTLLGAGKAEAEAG